ncbi:MAG: hypothetical protein JKY53_02980 [Flavobacteriales bacterium]|nr:hypothetical protein [Flavobacteriales bacterium]
MKSFLGTFLVLIITSYSGWTHGYHVSITQIDYNEKTKSLEIAIKLITEDVEQVLESQGAKKLFLGEENESEKADEYIKEYLQKHFVVLLNGTVAKPLYIGKEVEEGETWCYIEIKGVENIKSLSIKSTIFIEAYHNQTNRINLNVLGRGDSFVLSPAKVEDTVVF